MAEQTGTQEIAEEAPQGGGLMKKLMLAVAALVLVGVGAFVGLTFMGGDEVAVDADGNPIEAEADEQRRRSYLLHQPRATAGR